jgi:[acyl-carrier-protein] S-malonyltransferase
MAALRCATRDELDQLLARVRHQGVLEVAAHNAPTQWVVSGERAALGAVLGIAGGVMLPVAGPWHSSAMAGAAAAWERSLRELDWRPARRRLALAGSAAFATASTDLAATLARHLTRPVRWQETIEALLASGVAHLVAIGPGRVLRGLCREIAAGWMRERALAGDGVGLDGARAPVSVT